MKKYLLVLTVISLGFAARSQQHKVDIEGMINIDNSSYTINEAGEDFDGALTSASSFYLQISNEDFWNKKQSQTIKWRVFVHHTNDNWDEEIQLNIRREGKGIKTDGNGTPTVHDGDNFQNVTNTPTYFFRGKDELSLIPLAVQLQGHSLSMGSEQFDTNIVFTIHEGW